MKLATIDNQTRDGELLVVHPTQERYVSASSIVPNLQTALDDWDKYQPELLKLHQGLVDKSIAGEAIAYDRLLAPLPRAYEWVDGSAYINHIVLVRKARNAEPPETLRTSPLVYQGGSGILLGARADIELPDASWGLDYEAEVCVILGDTPRGTTAQDASKHIRLLMLANDVSLRNLIPPELKKGFGFFQSKPATAFSPFAVTPDELGDAWKDGRLHLPMLSQFNGEFSGNPDSGPEMHFSFHQLIEHICKTRGFTAGSILGSGTISNEDRSKGISCLAERRMIETIDEGAPKTEFMKVGDTIEIKMLDAKGQDIFGTISQKVVSA